MACCLKAPSHCLDDIKPEYIFPGGKYEKYSCFRIFPLKFGDIFHIHRHTKLGFFIETAMNFQWKCMVTLDCKYKENIFVDFVFVDFIRINGCDKSLKYTIWYQSLRYSPLTKMPPVYVAKLRLQTVVTSRTGVRVFPLYSQKCNFIN